MRITVSEQSSLPVRPRAAEEAGCIDAAQALAIIEAGERMGSRIAAWQGPQNLQIQQLVGLVQAPGLQLEILPKIEGLSEPAKVRHNLLAMLARTQDLDVRASEVAGFLEGSEPFLYALARLYIHRLMEAARRGLKQDYLLHQDLLPRLRGKIQWPEQIRLQAAGRLEMACAFDERSEDTLLNRTLKAALLVVARMLEGTKTSGRVTELRHVLDGVSAACPPAAERARLKTDRASHSLRPLLTLAKLILGDRNPDLGRSADGSHETYSLVWDMNVLFEEYVGRTAEQVLAPQGFRISRQETSTHLAQEVSRNRKAFLLKPDILVRLGAEIQTVAETKWKRLDPRSADLGMAESDVYQVLAYAHRFEAGRAVLLYPHHSALGQPGLQREFLVQGSIRVRVVTLNLAQLEEVPDQLCQGILRSP